MLWVSVFLVVLCLTGLVLHATALPLLRRYLAGNRHNQAFIESGVFPQVSILKPLKGNHTGLKEALETFFVFDYPAGYELLFGVADPEDPVLEVIEEIRKNYPQQPVSVVINDAKHGQNHKISNVINIFSQATHDILLLADDDILLEKGNLKQMVATLLRSPETGLVTVLYQSDPDFLTSLGKKPGLPERVAALHIDQYFLPGTLAGAYLKREDCFGAAMMFRRETLEQIGGFYALADHLADDAVLGILVKEQGLHVALAPVLAKTLVAETSFSEVWYHEIRWARTVRSLEPAGFLAGVLQYPLFFSTAALICSFFSAFFPWTFLVCAVIWVLSIFIRTGEIRSLGKVLGYKERTGFWLVIIREFFSLIIVMAGFAGQRVVWDGKILEAKKRTK